MKNILYLMFLLPISSYSQVGWNYLPNAPVVHRFDDIYFVDDSTGWAVNGWGEIYKTSDYGNSWTLQFYDKFHFFRAVEFLDNKNGFVGAFDELVYNTTDGGLTWNLINQNFPQQVPGICGIGHSGNTIIMLGVWLYPAYILRSTDAGQTWTYTSMETYGEALIDCWFKSKDTVFVSGMGKNETNNYGIILRSTDAGITWQQVGQSPNPNTYCWKLQFTSPTTGYSSCEEMTALSSHILKTIDGGTSWTPLMVVDKNIDMEGIGFVNDSTGWVGGWSEGMYKTKDGGNNWVYQDFGKNLNRFFFLSPNLGYAGGTSIYKFTDTIAIRPIPNPRNEFIHTFDLYPNPSKDILKITLHINRNTTALFGIYDAGGKLVNELVHGNLNKDTYKYEFNVSNIPKGNYFAVLRTNEHFLTKQFTNNGNN